MSMDEPILVVDIGSSSVKAGFSGEDVPSYVFPSSVGKATTKGMESMEAFLVDNAGAAAQYISATSSHPMNRGVVKDWGQMEKLWGTISETINTSNESTSVFLVESFRSTPADRVKWAELLFEKGHAPSICIGNSASLSIFASGRTTGVAVECGAGLTTTVPIFEGLSLRHAAVCVEYGGQDVTVALRKLFNEKNVQIDMLSAKQVKERLAYVHGYATYEGAKHTPEQVTFTLPDGNDVTIDPRMFSTCTDVLFDNGKGGGLINQVHESIVLCDESVKKDLANNIILSGGTTMLPGLGDKLNASLMNKFARESDPKNSVLTQSIRVVPNSNYRERGFTLQRKHAAWIGGSLLGSFDTYHKNLKITRQEWEENPDVLLNTRCF